MSKPEIPPPRRPLQLAASITAKEQKAKTLRLTNLWHALAENQRQAIVNRLTIMLEKQMPLCEKEASDE